MHANITKKCMYFIHFEMGALLNTNMLILILWGRRDHTHSNTLRLKGYKQSCYLTLNLLFEKGALLHLSMLHIYTLKWEKVLKESAQ